MKKDRKLWATLCLLVLAASLAAAQTVHTRGDSDPGPYQPYDPYSGPNVIPSGTTFLMHLTDTLDTDRMSSGQRFQGKLDQDLVAPSGDLIPRGRKIKGHVSEIDRGFHGRILLSFDQIETRHGWVPLIATVVGVPGEHGVLPDTGPEGEIEKRGVDKRRAAEAAVIGGAVGATTGAIAGGGKGAAIGAAVGAGLGGGAGILTDRDLRLNKGQELEVRLDRGIQIPSR